MKNNFSQYGKSKFNESQKMKSNSGGAKGFSSLYSEKDQKFNFRKNNINVNKKISEFINEEDLDLYHKNIPLDNDHVILEKTELLNFFGVLNFRVKKYNKNLLEKAFDCIYNKYLEKESKLQMLAFGCLVKKDKFLLDLERLSKEVIRRANSKQESIFRINKVFNSKKKYCLNMIRLFCSGNIMDYSNLSITDAGTYVGNIIFLY